MTITKCWFQKECMCVWTMRSTKLRVFFTSSIRMNMKNYLAKINDFWKDGWKSHWGKLCFFFFPDFFLMTSETWRNHLLLTWVWLYQTQCNWRACLCVHRHAHAGHKPCSVTDIPQSKRCRLESCQFWADAQRLRARVVTVLLILVMSPKPAISTVTLLVSVTTLLPITPPGRHYLTHCSQVTGSQQLQSRPPSQKVALTSAVKRVQPLIYYHC